MRTRLAILFCVAFILCTGHHSLRTDVRAATESPEGNAAKGKIIFLKYCAGCHGPEGQGDGYQMLGRKPANLTEAASSRKSEAELLTAIHEGRPNMPPWNARLTNEDSRDVLAYIRTLSGGRETQPN